MLQITLPPEAPGGPPINLLVAARSSTSIVLQWNPPAEGDRNGEIQGYVIQYKLAGNYPFPPLFPLSHTWLAFNGLFFPNEHFADNFFLIPGYDTNPWSEKKVPANQQLPYILDELIVWQTYKVKVAAYNIKGTGVFSDPQTVRTKESPPESAPRLFRVLSINSTAIEVGIQRILSASSMTL